jgi:hypothetical protein
MNLQGFIKQPRINGRQARWLIYLTPYDFIIRHRPGSLNPADGPLRRPDFLSRAREIPGLIQKDMLTGRLARSDLTGRAGEISSQVQTNLPASKLVRDLPKAARPELPLCNIAKCQLCEVARRAPDSQLCEAARATRRVNNLSPLVDSKGQ